MSNLNPKLSAIFVASDARPYSERILQSLLHQNAIDQMEILIVDCSLSETAPIKGAEHPNVRTIRRMPNTEAGKVRAEAVQMAQAPLVALLEEHSTVLPGWAEAVIEAHEGPWVAVGGEEHLGNPGIGVSDAVFLATAAYWAPPAPRGETYSLNAHDVVYKRKHLLAFGEDLAALIICSPLLQRRLLEAGHRFFVEPNARYTHTFAANPSTLINHIHWSRYYGYVRMTMYDWPMWKRLFRISCSPLLPFYRTGRLLWYLLRQRPERLWLFMYSWPFILLTDAVSVVSEALGILFGPGKSLDSFTWRHARGTGLPALESSLSAKPSIKPADTPQLSVIIMVGAIQERAANALRSVLQQNIIEDMEILLVHCLEEMVPLPNSDHPQVRAIHLPGMTYGAGRAEAVQQAQAPIVAFLEEHCLAMTGWAESQLKDHQEGWAGVCGIVYNANPGVGFSDATYLSSYAPWLPGNPRREVVLMPGHNSSYMRDILLSYGDKLVDLLSVEPVLQWQLHQDGHKMLLDPNVRFAHLNEGRPQSWIINFVWSRYLGSVRARIFHWPSSKKLLYFLLVPGIPWVRLLRLFTSLARYQPRRLWVFFWNSPIMLIGEYISALGQAVGLLFGAGDSAMKFTERELGLRNVR